LEDGKVRRLGGKQEFEFNVRVIAATKQERGTQSGRKLREDLYYRLTLPVHLPPLRDRKEISRSWTALHWRVQQKARARFAALRDDAMEMLMTYSWPATSGSFGSHGTRPDLPRRVD